MIAPDFPFGPSLEAPFVKAWFFDDTATVVHQVLSTEMTPAIAGFLAGPMQLALQRRYVLKGRKVRYVHDWRACAKYVPAARDTLIEWGRAGASGTAEVLIGMGQNASPFIRIALTTGTLVMRGLGMRISVVESLEPVLAPLRALGAAANLER